MAEVKLRSLGAVIRNAKLAHQGDPGVILGPAEFKRGAKARGVAWVIRDAVVPQLDSAVLCDQVRRHVVELHAQAISAGLKADGSGVQPELAPHRLKIKRLKPVRGMMTGTFYGALGCAPMRTRAKRKTVLGDVGLESIARVGWPLQPGAARQLLSSRSSDRHDFTAFLKNEAKRGVRYLYVTGEVATSVHALLGQLLPRMLAGERPKVDAGSFRVLDI